MYEQLPADGESCKFSYTFYILFNYAHEYITFPEKYTHIVEQGTQLPGKVNPVSGKSTKQLP